MHLQGVVTLNDDEIGTFELDDEERVAIAFHKGAAGVSETLEFAADQGLRFSLMLKPAYGPKD